MLGKLRIFVISAARVLRLLLWSLCCNINILRRAVARIFDWVGHKKLLIRGDKHVKLCLNSLILHSGGTAKRSFFRFCYVIFGVWGCHWPRVPWLRPRSRVNSYKPVDVARWREWHWYKPCHRCLVSGIKVCSAFTACGRSFQRILAVPGWGVYNQYDKFDLPSNWTMIHIRVVCYWYMNCFLCKAWQP